MYGGLAQGTQHQEVFISYSSKDEAEARAAAKALRYAGVSYWFAAEGMRWGSWPGQIVEGIRNCRVVVVLLSPDANRSVHVRREVFLATEFQKPLVPMEVSQGELHDDLKYLLGMIEIFRPLDLRRLVAEVAQARAPDQARPIRPLSRFVRACVGLSGILAVPLLIWADLFTEAGWPVFLVLAAPLVVYRVLPDSWQRWAVATMRTAWTTPSLVQRLLCGAVSLGLTLLLAWTFTVGTVAVVSNESMERRVELPNVERKPKTVSLGHTRTFQIPAGYPAVVRVERLPDRSRTPHWWTAVWLHVPRDFVDKPTVLIAQDDSLDAMANRQYSARIDVVRGGQVSDETRIELSSGDPPKAIAPFWVGCHGFEEARAPQVQGLVQHPPPINSAYPCLFHTHLVRDDRVCVTVEQNGERGFELVRSFDRRLNEQTTDNQYGIQISNRYGSMQPCK